MKSFKCAFVLICSLFISVVSFSAVLSPLGYWKQYSDGTGQLQSLIKIWRSKKGDLRGTVVAGYAMNGKAPGLYCVKCPGPFHNKRIVGQTILWGLQYQNGYWQDGHILDPNSGSIYHAQLRLLDNGNKISARGYIGISLFGRSQTWVRVPANQLNALMKKAYPQPKKMSL